MVKRLAQIFGAILALVGILGFVPGVTTDGLLLGIFRVDTTHNIIHLVTGIIGLYAGFTSYNASRVFFLIFGIVYALVAILGFISGDEPILGVIASNMADSWLHVAIALVAVFGYLGFVAGEDNAA